MATVRSSLPHEERTADQPRIPVIERVRLAHIRDVNSTVRLLRLHAIDPQHTIKFSPGQWVDTFIPGLQQAGGFTITSTPQEARPSSHSPAYLELAIQKSENPPAKWLWRPSEDILGAPLAVRVGGSFIWPPPHYDGRQVDRLVLIAGGVGINPLISIFSYLIRVPIRPPEIHFVYLTKVAPELDAQSVLFLPRLMDLIAMEADPRVTLSMFLTGGDHDIVIDHGKFPNRTFGRRATNDDLVQAIDGYQQSIYGPEHDRAKTLCYVCGPPRMTDEMVKFLSTLKGMAPERVLCEKWW